VSRTCDERTEPDDTSDHEPWNDDVVGKEPSAAGADLDGIPGSGRVIESFRRLVAGAVRSRVVGADADQRAAELFEAPGDRWFAEESAIRVVHGDTSMFIGGLRALLLQSLHPLAMAGVAQHSDYKSDPWGRLQRTADFLAATTYGPTSEAQRAVDMVKRVHTRVIGTASDGRPYSANDPHLLKWVHLAEIDSFVAAHRRFGAQKLSTERYDEYVEQMARVAEALGVENPPRTIAEMKDQLRVYRPELRASEEARDAARYLLLTPPLPLVARAPYGVLASAAVSLLPVWARVPLRLPWLPLSERALVRPVGDALSRLLRWAMQPEAPR